MKPFLLLQSRPEDAASDNEYDSFCKFGGLEPARLKRIAMHKGELTPLNLDDYAGILMGGGPANISDPEDKKSAAQKQFEPILFDLVKEIAARDFPFLGACLAIGALTKPLGGVVSRAYPEAVGPVEITLTQAGQSDPLTAGLPTNFQAFVGHKEACETLPPGATLLASSPTCPVQMFRVGKNVYTTQFHPELDAASLALRINIYKDAGYFKPTEVEELVAMAHASVVTTPVEILRRFIARFA